MAAATSTTCRSATPTAASSTRSSAAAVRTTPTAASPAAATVGTASARTTSTMAAAGAASTAARPTAAAISAMAPGKAAASGLQRATVVGDGCGDGSDSRSVHDLFRHIEGLQLGIEGQRHSLGGHHFRAPQSVFHHVRLHTRGLDVG